MYIHTHTHTQEKIKSMLNIKTKRMEKIILLINLNKVHTLIKMVQLPRKWKLPLKRRRFGGNAFYFLKVIVSGGKNKSSIGLYY
jgi:hypothetical protein